MSGAARSTGWRRSLSRPWLWAALVAALTLAAALLAWAGGPEQITRLFVRHDGTWAAMQARGTWRVGLDPSFPPFEMLDEAGNPVGYDVDLARRIAETWGLDVEIVALGFDSLLDAVQAGRIDSVVSALPYDPRVTREIAYSSPYFEAGVRLAVRAGSPITGVAGLDGTAVAVEWGSMSDMVGRRLQREGSALELVPYASADEAAAALADDPAIDALLADNVTLRQAQGQGAAVIAAGPALESNAYVIASARQATVLHENIEQALATLRAGGVLDELEDRWFGAAASSP
jgi:polar amino acid transport system substrate-binding protein